MSSHSSAARRLFIPKWVSLFILPVILLLTGTFNLTASAQVPEFDYNVKMTARSLFDGAYKYGDWLPVEITLENYGAATTVQIETVVNNNFNSSNFPVTYRRTVSLGERSNKRFHFYIQPFVANSNVSRFVSSDQSILLKTADGGRKLFEQNIRLLPVSPKDYLVGVLNADAGLVANLNTMRVGKLNSRVSVVNISPTDFPDKAEGWRSFNALALSDTSTTSLNSDQIAAIKNWVGDGGQLILMGGNGWSKVSGGFDRDFLPVNVYDYQQTSNLDDLLPMDSEKPALASPVILAIGEVLQGAHSLAVTNFDGNRKVNNLPLLAERRIGNGRVIFSAANLASNPLIDWAGTMKAWQGLLGFNSGIYYQIYDDSNPHLKNNSEFFPFVSLIPDLSLPDISFYLMIFGGYLLLIAPLNYLVLRKLRRPQLAWVTIPLLSIIFSGVTVSLVNKQQPGDALVNQMSVIQVAPGQSTAQVRSYVAVFSSQDKQYEVSPVVPDGQPSPLLLPINRNAGNSFNLPDTDRTVVYGDQPRIEKFRVGQWSAQGFSVEGRVPAAEYQIQNSLYLAQDDKQGRIKGTITNTTGKPIRGVLLALGDQIQKVKDLDPGESTSIDFQLPSPTSITLGYCTLGYGTYTAYTNTSIGEKLQNALQENRNNDKVYQNRGAFLRKVYEIGRYSLSNPQRGLDLIGWIDDNPMEITVEGASPVQKSSQVLIARLPVNLDSPNGDGRFSLPASYLYPDNEYSDTANVAVPSSRLERNDIVCLTKGTVTAEYNLPVNNTLWKPSKMVLYLNSFAANSGRAPILPTSVELFDWQQKSWVQLKGLVNSAQTSGSSSTVINSPSVPNEIQNPARFANPQTGKVAIRFGSPTAGALTQFALEIEGGKN